MLKELTLEGEIDKVQIAINDIKKYHRLTGKQAGNSIPVPIFESMFDTLLNGGKKIYSSQQTLL